MLFLSYVPNSLIVFLLVLFQVQLCLSTRIISPAEFATNEITTPRMLIGNSSTFPMASFQLINFTSYLAATSQSLCNTHSLSAAEIAYFKNKTLMVYGFQGCSYEKVAYTAQQLNITAIIFQSRKKTPGHEATFTDGKKSTDIYIPLFVMGKDHFDDVRAIAVNRSYIEARISANKNPWDHFIDSPAPIVIQMLGSFLSLLWILASIRGLYYSHKLQSHSVRKGMKVMLSRAVLYIELVSNCIRFALFATDPFLIKSNPLLSWSAYVSLLIIPVPLGFISCVCFLFLCLLILLPSRVFYLKAFFVAITLAILGVDLGACGTNASYKNPRGVDIYAVSFTLNGVEGIIIGVTLAISCINLLIVRNKQIRYSPRALKKLAVIGLVESFFLLLGAFGSFAIAWLSNEAVWLDVFALCIHWAGLFGASGCQIACFPKGKRIKKIKVIKVVDNDFTQTAHPMKKIVL